LDLPRRRPRNAHNALEYWGIILEETSYRYLPEGAQGRQVKWLEPAALKTARDMASFGFSATRLSGFSILNIDSGSSVVASARIVDSEIQAVRWNSTPGSTHGNRLSLLLSIALLLPTHRRRELVLKPRVLLSNGILQAQDS
jgi:hypothetical protein